MLAWGAAPRRERNQESPAQDGLNQTEVSEARDRADPGAQRHCAISFTGYTPSQPEVASHSEHRPTAVVIHRKRRFDQTHAVKISTIYELPFGRGRKWMNRSGEGIGGGGRQANRSKEGAGRSGV